MPCFWQPVQHNPVAANLTCDEFIHILPLDDVKAAGHGHALGTLVGLINHAARICKNTRQLNQMAHAGSRTCGLVRCAYLNTVSSVRSRELRTGSFTAFTAYQSAMVLLLLSSAQQQAMERVHS